MRIPFLGKTSERTSAAARERTDGLERRLTETLRTIAMLCSSAADQIERRRLQRAGYETPGRFLERHEDKR